MQLALWVVGRYGGLNSSGTKPRQLVDLVMSTINAVPMSEDMQTMAMMSLAKLVVAARMRRASFPPSLDSYLQQRLSSKNQSHQRVAHWIYTLSECAPCI